MDCGTCISLFETSNYLYLWWVGGGEALTVLPPLKHNILKNIYLHIFTYAILR